MPLTESRPVRFVLRAWYAFRLLRLRTRPQPVDVPAIRSGDPRADRVLVVGNGPSHGWGVLSHQLGLVGRLADAVAGQTGRPCDIDLIGAEAMNVRSAMAWIGDRDLGEEEAVVLVVGVNDALRLTPVAVWRRELSDLLDGVAARMRPEAALAIAGIPPLSSFSAYGSFSAHVSESHRARLNTATRQIAARRHIRYIDLPASDDRTTMRSPETVYRDFAERIADRIAPLLLEARPKARPRPARAPRVPDWSGTPAIVAAARDGGEPELRRLTEHAQRQFGVELAVVSLVDGDRLYHGTNTDVLPASVPLDLSFCRYTVESGEVTVIPDTGKDPRFADNPLTDVSFINFYAGYPLRASDGRVIGSFCLQGSRPRTPSEASLERLRDLALEAQGVLRRYEIVDAAPAHDGPALPGAMAAPTGERVLLDRD
ncbi:GAF domain-containing protein [Pseudolysinimonas sp.]|uniref:GAF domain-containing protein n=1 Tax=Pseudolysinimonas sp. TaxID=2680009 RepID=UPI003F7FF13D